MSDTVFADVFEPALNEGAHELIIPLADGYELRAKTFHDRLEFALFRGRYFCSLSERLEIIAERDSAAGFQPDGSWLLESALPPHQLTKAEADQAVSYVRAKLGYGNDAPSGPRHRASSLSTEVSG